MKINKELGRHEETTSSAQGRVGQVMGMMNQAGSILQNMSQREVHCQQTKWQALPVWASEL
jgi:hypothetical protein